jgi:DNA-binding SARP family transcriptional activator
MIGNHRNSTVTSPSPEQASNQQRTLMAEVKIFLFGTPRLEISARPVTLGRRKAAALIAYLALTEQPQSRDVLAALLWPESDHEQARAALRSTLSALTTAAPLEWTEADRIAIGLKRSALWVDVLAFKQLIQQIDAHHASGEPLCSVCVNHGLEAADLYRADFLHGFHISDSREFDEWQFAQCEWLRREYADLQRRLTLHFAAEQQFDEALRHAQLWSSCDPLDEPPHRQLMRLYAANGQRSEALRQYQTCKARLAAELATPPEHETTALYESILHNRPVIPAPASVESQVPFGVMPPLPALVIGREEALREIKQRVGVGNVAGRPVTVIHGWPGVGKSTTVAKLTHDREIADAFPDGVLWASLGQTPNLMSELMGWAHALGLGDSVHARKLEDITAQLTTAARDQRMLLVIDDVWQTEHVKPFRVGGQHCATVMTSRLFDVALALAPTSADVYRLPVLTENASLELLGSLTPETVASYPHEARELVNDLEGLPLAIHVAGRLLHTEANMGWGIQDLLGDLRAGASLLAAQPPAELLVVGRDASPTVAALLNRSTDLLDEETRRRFALLGLFVPKPATFDLAAMAAAWDLTDPRPIARRLVSFGLLEPVSGGRFQMHALLVLHAQTLLGSDFAT